ncbi:retinoic acid receptor responder protein 1 [Bombina bombina]|uniref:retinoic acid receptor responder protein 1 n=1 Tax=Bombina bombina TaxID=8345 RepID=UPI00235B0EB1|nr:retinoic acid receptor responder protein 1 [Bombina bombina]
MQQLLCLFVLLPLATLALPFSVPDDFWSARKIPTSQRAARETAQVAVQYLNYYYGSPNNLRMVHEVKRASVKSFPDIGNKYYIEFSTRDIKTNEITGLCTAKVFFRTNKPRPAINVDCSNDKDLKKAQEDDYDFYKNMKTQTTPITGKNIPDSFGFVEPKFEPLQDLAIMGSSYVMWEKTTENLHYNMAQIKSLKQVLRQDDLIGFDYDILLHETPTQAVVICSVHVVWIPGKPPKVEYECSGDSEENGSGSESEEGSTFMGNFK